MIDRKFMAEARERYAVHSSLRREIIKLAGDAQNRSKKAIFALHRDDMEEGNRLLAEAEAKFAEARERIKESPELADEGSYRAGLEEYLEAVFYRNFVRDGEVRAVEFPDADYETVIGALSDLTGELQRRQVKAAIDRKIDEARRLLEVIDAIVGELLNMDLEGYLRNKFDQAKNSQRRAEDVMYDLSLRER